MTTAAALALNDPSKLVTLVSNQSLVQYDTSLEAKDPYTHGHSVRVSQYATAIARRLDLPANVIRAVTLGGRLHDIGKIGVREEILTKPARLTPEEYAHVMTHMTVGWRILSARS